MNHSHRYRLTLSGRILLCLIVFSVALATQVFVSHLQTSTVTVPMQERTETIQAISQFLTQVDGCMAKLEEYHWEYGEAPALAEAVHQHLTTSSQQLELFRAAQDRAEEEARLLSGAVQTTYRYFLNQMETLLQYLSDDKESDAAQVYYEQVLPCGQFLLQYSRELLEQAILDNHDAFESMQEAGGRIRNLQLVTMTFETIATIILAVSLFSLLRSVRQLSQASLRISRGELEIPDVDDRRQDEIGHMAKAFNEMKRSLKGQMDLLVEKNEMERELRRKETEALELQNLVEAGKLQLLRSQIHPHFLFNTLSMITYKAQQENAAQTGAMIGSLSRIFRYALGSNEARVPLSKEVQIVNDFYSLYHARFGDRIRLQWLIDPEIELTETMIPSFLIQPLVENAIQHGLAPKEDGGCVEIEIKKDDDLLRISVKDDGVGISQEEMEKLKGRLESPFSTGEHIGLYNVAARLRLSGQKHGLEIQSEAEGGTCAVMHLPLVIEG